MFDWINRKRYRRLDDRYTRLVELVEGLDETIWPHDYRLAREELAQVTRKRASVGARLFTEDHVRP